MAGSAHASYETDADGSNEILSDPHLDGGRPLARSPPVDCVSHPMNQFYSYMTRVLHRAVTGVTYQARQTEVGPVIARCNTRVT